MQDLAGGAAAAPCLNKFVLRNFISTFPTRVRANESRSRLFRGGILDFGGVTATFSRFLLVIRLPRSPKQSPRYQTASGTTGCVGSLQNSSTFLLSRGGDSARTCFKSNDGSHATLGDNCQTTHTLSPSLLYYITALIVPNSLNQLVVTGVNRGKHFSI